MVNPLKKTMVYLGLSAEDEYEHTEAYDGDLAPVTPLRRAVAAVPPVSTMNEIAAVHPRQYSEAREIAARMRDGVPVIINVSQMSDAEARRLVDFCSGLVEGLQGRIERITAKVFLLSPAHILTTGDAQQAEPTAAVAQI